jgi:hypothetical protein
MDASALVVTVIWEGVYLAMVGSVVPSADQIAGCGL